MLYEQAVEDEFGAPERTERCPTLLQWLKDMRFFSGPDAYGHEPKRKDSQRTGHIYNRTMFWGRWGVCRNRYAANEDSDYGVCV